MTGMPSRKLSAMAWASLYSRGWTVRISFISWTGVAFCAVVCERRSGVTWAPRWWVCGLAGRAAAGAAAAGAAAGAARAAGRGCGGLRRRALLALRRLLLVLVLEFLVGEAEVDHRLPQRVGHGSSGFVLVAALRRG